MNPSEQSLLSFFLPEGIQEYLELTKVEKEYKELQIYLEEKNSVPSGFQKENLESKGFFPEESIQDFLMRGQKIALRIKRCRWTVKKTGDIISRDWDLVIKGARMAKEFGLFLKGIFG